ncbi:transcriptional regulator, partial [Nostoc sp. 3335mG]
IRSVHDALNELGSPPEPAAPPAEPAVPVRASVKPDYIVCLEDGRKLKMLKRHLMTHYNLTPEQYRAKWNLPADYPMVAPNYAEQRRTLAKKIGLGTQRRTR